MHYKLSFDYSSKAVFNPEKQIMGLLLLLLSFFSYGQLKVKWDITHGTLNQSDMTPRNAIQDDKGFFVVTGWSTNVLGVSLPSAPDPDGNYAHAGQDFTLLKIDTNGNVIWNNALGGASLDDAQRVIQTHNGDYIIVGSTFSNDGDVSALTDPDGSGHHDAFGTSSDAWIIRLNSNGIMQWQNAIGGTGTSSPSGSDGANSVIETNSGDLLIVGGTNSLNGDAAAATDVDGNGWHTSVDPGSPLSDAWVVKMDAAGHIIWQNILGGGGYDIATCAVEADDGSYIIAGRTASYNGDASALTDVDGSGLHDIGGNGYNGDFWIFKLDATGHLLWQNVLGGTGFEHPSDIIKVNGGYIIGGHTSSEDGDISAATDIDGSGNHGGTDYWVIKIDENGHLLWQNAIGSYFPYFDYEPVYSLHATCDGGAIIAGDNMNVLGNNGDKTEPNPGKRNFWIVRIDGNGNKLWDKTIGSMCQLFDDTEGEVIPTSDGGYFLSGHSSNPPGGDKTAPHIYADWWMVKLEYQLKAGFTNDFVCAGAPVTFNDTTFVDTPLPEISHIWYFGDPVSGSADTAHIPNPAHTYALPGTYSITLIVQKDCKFDTTRKSIVVNAAPSNEITGNINLCKGDSTVLNIAGGTSYSWSTGATTYSISVFPTSTTQYIVVASNGICTNTVAAIVTVKQSPVPNAGPDSTICLGASVVLNASGGSSFIWNTDPSLTENLIPNPTATPLDTTLYIITVSNGSCFEKDTVVISVLPLPTAEAGSNVVVHLGESTGLNATGNGKYLWTPSNGLSCPTCQNTIATPHSTTMYYLTVTSANGCTAIDSVLVTVDLLCMDLFVPTAFSPNTDEQNDLLYVKGSCLETFEFRIYNRWGEAVFLTTDITKGWDGKDNGRKEMLTCVYAYKLHAVTVKGEKIELHGNISLIR